MISDDFFVLFVMLYFGFLIVVFFFIGMFYLLEFSCLFNGIIYFFCLLFGYLVFNIYSVVNIIDRFWGKFILKYFFRLVFLIK